MLLELPVHRESPFRPVQTLMVYLEEDCNLRCTYCFVAKKPRRMTAETAEKVVRFLFREDVSGPQDSIHVNFFGGEPFLAIDRMEQIVDLALRQGQRLGKAIFFSATTNGTLFSERIARLVERARMSILLSLDGDEQSSELRPFVSGRASHDLVVKNLANFLRVADGRVTVRATFHTDDFRLAARARYLKSLGATSIALCPVVECDWGPYETALIEEYEQLGNWFLGCLASGEYPPLDITWLLLRQWLSYCETQARPERPCQVGHTLLGIDPDGNVMPCHRFLYRAMDWLGTVDAPDLLGDKRLPYTQISSNRMPDCKSCLAEPVCGGGCRVVALNQRLGLHDVYAGHCIPMRAHAHMVYWLCEKLLQMGNAQAAREHVSPLSPAIQELLLS